jgi:hypothetical protein
MEIDELTYWAAAASEYLNSGPETARASMDGSSLSIEE